MALPCESMADVWCSLVDAPDVSLHSLSSAAVELDVATLNHLLFVVNQLFQYHPSLVRQTELSTSSPSHETPTVASPIDTSERSSVSPVIARPVRRRQIIELSDDESHEIDGKVTITPTTPHVVATVKRQSSGGRAVMHCHSPVFCDDSEEVVAPKPSVFRVYNNKIVDDDSSGGDCKGSELGTKKSPPIQLKPSIGVVENSTPKHPRTISRRVIIDDDEDDDSAIYPPSPLTHPPRSTAPASVDFSLSNIKREAKTKLQPFHSKSKPCEMADASGSDDGFIVSDDDMDDEAILSADNDDDYYKRLDYGNEDSSDLSNNEDFDDENSDHNRNNGTSSSMKSKESKKQFSKSRDIISKNLFFEFNKSIFKDFLPANMEIKWSKTLRKTAGLTYCRSKTNPVNNDIERTALIELSMKVLDDEHKLRNTLVHELCHAAAWLVDKTCKPPHGSAFKKWGKLAERRYKDIKVTTCHSYTITYKYKYICQCCGQDYGRHSKSLDVERQRCGKCRGVLALQPNAKSDGTPSKPRQQSEYQLFLKNQFPIVKSQHPNLKHADAMKFIAGLWREFKQNADKKRGTFDETMEITSRLQTLTM